MGKENRSRKEQKKGFSGSFTLFLFLLLLLIFLMQNVSNGQTNEVAFSYQVEHLVNLDLIQEAESRKIAQNDHLVTFTGKFRERLSPDSKSRHAYLDLLNKHNELQEEQQQLRDEVAYAKNHVVEAARWFLLLSGKQIPAQGYWVVTPFYDLADQKISLSINSLPESQFPSLSQLNASFPPSPENIEDFRKKSLSLLQGFRSPALGIGSESMKQKLAYLEQVAPSAQQSFQDQLEGCRNILFQLGEIVDQLDKEVDNLRLMQLRSVRSYVGGIRRYQEIYEEMDRNKSQLDKARQAVAETSWFFNNQELSTKALEKQDPELFGIWYSQEKQEWNRFQANRGAVFKVPDQPRNLVLEKRFKSEEPSPNYFAYFLTLLPVLLLAGFLYYIFFARQVKGMGGSAMSFGKSPARRLEKDRDQVTFQDVAGCDEAKEELQEIVEFLKNPGKFTSLGARIPKGVLCIGAPGTGKTLIAKAVAGEAGAPFFFISGSDFVEMFVGVGASRVRDMVEQARKNAPCILFIDEIDAVGRQRGAGMGGGHDEREQTLNQLLVEMDGFKSSQGVIFMAATNRPDVLDTALLRPGRFDRRIFINLPDIKGRFDILKVHARKIKLDPSVDLMDIARITSGSSGADLANMLNEAALLAARHNLSAVTAVEIREAVDKVKYGKERRSLEIDEHEKRSTAYHESGHAVVGFSAQFSDPIDKVTIIPRGPSLGSTHFMPKKNRLSYWKRELHDQLMILMGGRAAEEIFLKDSSSGAQQDISQATRLARSMVCEWGMSDLGTVAYDEKTEHGGVPFDKNYSDETAQQIDLRVRAILDEAHRRAVEIINSHKEAIEVMVQMLLEFETLDSTDVVEIFEGRWSLEKKKARLKDVEESNKKLTLPFFKEKGTPQLQSV